MGTTSTRGSNSIIKLLAANPGTREPPAVGSGIPTLRPKDWNRRVGSKQTEMDF